MRSSFSKALCDTVVAEGFYNYQDAGSELKKRANKEKAKILQRFFKTGPGEYAQGDIFLGITVPVIRKLAAQYQDLDLKAVVRLLKSSFHEERLLALLVLIFKFGKEDEQGKKAIYEIYLKHTRYINNWDLVDLSAPQVIGAFLVDKPRIRLYKLAKSRSLWERRIAILATFYFIKRGDFEDTLKIARILLSDKHDLIHKAVGWMLREAGKRDMAREEAFLKKHRHVMPRTMLRYAIERFEERKRQSYLRG